VDFKTQTQMLIFPYEIKTECIKAREPRPTCLADPLPAQLQTGTLKLDYRPAFGTTLGEAKEELCPVPAASSPGSQNSELHKILEVNTAAQSSELSRILAKRRLLSEGSTSGLAAPQAQSSNLSTMKASAVPHALPAEKPATEDSCTA